MEMKPMISAPPPLITSTTLTVLQAYPDLFFSLGASRLRDLCCVTMAQNCYIELI